MEPAFTSTAASHGLACCHVCGLTCRMPRAIADAHCPRCLSRLHLRKPYSMQRTWALVLTAYIAYIPANILPILETHTLGGTQGNTIMSGVLLFWDTGSWMIAALIFVASFVVPLTKLIAVTLLLLSIHLRVRWRPYQRTQLYRLVELVGKWSMLDIFVVALSVALVHVQSFASMRAGPGALAFGAVVVLTMFAAEAFDPRLIWDASRERDG